MADNSLQGGTDTIRDLARQAGTVKTQTFQLDLGGASANAEVLISAGQKTMALSMPVVLASDQTPLSVNNPVNATISATFTAADAVVGAPVGDGTLVSGASTAGSIISLVIPDGYVGWTLLLKNWANGTVYTEASTNSTNGTDGDWVEVKGRRTGTAPGTESVVYAMVASGYYRGNGAGFKYIRARFFGGTTFPTAAWTLSTGSGASFLNSGIPGGTSLIGYTEGTAGAFLARDGTDITTPTAMPAGGLGIRGWLSAIWTKLNGTLGVTGTFWQATQPVSLATNTPDVTDRAARLLGVVTGAGSATLALDGTDITTPTAMPAGGVGLRGWLSAIWTKLNGTLGVTGTFFQATQPVSLATNTPTLQASAAVIGALVANQTVNSAQINGVAPLMGNGVSGTGSQRVNIASDNTAFPVNATLSAETTKVIGTVNQATLTKSTQGTTGVTTQPLRDAGRVNVAITCYQAAGIITTEALFAAASFSISRDGATATTGQQLAVTAGKRFRLQSIVVSVKNTAAVAGTSKLALRYLAAGGAITNASPMLAILDMGTNGTVANAYIDPTEMSLPDGVELIAASTFGFTNLSSAITMLHTITVNGYEY